MKASYCTKYGGPEVYQVLEVEKPSPKENEVIVKVYRAVVSPTDANFRSGKPLIARLFSGLLKPRVKIHGEMFVGRIDSVGKSVQDFQQNEMVYGSTGMKLGAYAEYVPVNVVKNTIKKIPGGVNYIDALPLLDGGITALPFLKELGKVQEGDAVLVNGASGAVGSMAVMIARHLGATVTGVCSTKNVETVKNLGAHKVIDYTKENFTDVSNRYDIVFDTVGKSSFKESKNALKDAGLYMTTMPTPSVMIQALTKKKSLNKRASFMAAGLRKPDVKIKDLEYLEELLLNGELKPLHGKVYNLDELGSAQSYVETGHKVGNVSLIINE